MKTKITLALAILGLSATAFAGTPGNNMVVPTGTPVIAPDSTGIWSFGLEALYMESNTNFQYGSYATLPTDGSGVVEQKNKSVSTDWNWGVEANISYLFPGSSRDISASYTYLNQDGNDSITSPANVAAVLSGPNLPGDGLFDSAKGDVNQSLNAATLTLGQLVTVGDHLALHPFGGIQFADIDDTNKANYYEVNDAVATYKEDSDFTGAGPRAGIDAIVHLGNGFSIIGTFAGALLVGNMNSQLAINENILGDTEETQSKRDSYTTVVPELDAKIGLDYLYAINPSTSMNFQLGYELVNYFNAESNDALDLIASNSISNTSDFNYNGLYFKLQLNVA